MVDGKKDKSGALVGPPCGTVNGGEITESLQYGWSRGLVNMPIQKGFDFHGSMQIKASPRNGPKKVGRV